MSTSIWALTLGVFLLCEIAGFVRTRCKLRFKILDFMSIKSRGEIREWLLMMSAELKNNMPIKFNCQWDLLMWFSTSCHFFLVKKNTKINKQNQKYHSLPNLWKQKKSNLLNYLIPLRYYRAKLITVTQLQSTQLGFTLLVVQVLLEACLSFKKVRASGNDRTWKYGQTHVHRPTILPKNNSTSPIFIYNYYLLI